MSDFNDFELPARCPLCGAKPMGMDDVRKFRKEVRLPESRGVRFKCFTAVYRNGFIDDTVECLKRRLDNAGHANWILREKFLSTQAVQE